jgi:hypothetical protein
VIGAWREIRSVECRIQSKNKSKTIVNVIKEEAEARPLLLPKRRVQLFLEVFVWKEVISCSSFFPPHFGHFAFPAS